MEVSIFRVNERSSILLLSSSHDLKSKKLGGGNPKSGDKTGSTENQERLSTRLSTT